MHRLTVGLGTSTIEPGPTGGHVDGIGVYNRALLSHLPQAGVEAAPYSRPHRAGPSVVGQPRPHSFARASLADLALPLRRLPMPADLFHATDYRIVRMAWLRLPQGVRRERALVTVGAAGWRCETLLRRIDAARANGENVVWLDRLGGATALRHVYAGAGVCAFPSLYEGFGIPLLEAFASNLPVVTSNTSSLPEVSQGAALEVDPLDEGALSDAMLVLVRDESLRARCIGAGRVRAAAMTWRATAHATAAVYRTLLKQ